MLALGLWLTRFKKSLTFHSTTQVTSTNDLCILKSGSTNQTFVSSERRFVIVYYADDVRMFVQIGSLFYSESSNPGSHILNRSSEVTLPLI